MLKQRLALAVWTFFDPKNLITPHPPTLFPILPLLHHSVRQQMVRPQPGWEMADYECSQWGVGCRSRRSRFHRGESRTLSGVRPFGHGNGRKTLGCIPPGGWDIRHPRSG